MNLPRHIYRKVPVPRLYAYIVDSSNAQLLLAQIYYWDKRVRRTNSKRDGWFWKTFDDWFFELGLSKGQVYTAVKPLIDSGLVERETRPYRNQTRVWYRLNRSALAKILNQARADMKAWINARYQGFDSKPRGSDYEPTGTESYPTQNTTHITPQSSYTTQPQQTPKQPTVGKVDCSSEFFKNLTVPKRLGDLNLPYFFANSGLNQQTMQDILDITGLQARDGFRSNVGGFIQGLVRKAQADPVNGLDTAGARMEQRIRAELQVSLKPKAPPPPQSKVIPANADEKIQVLIVKLTALKGTGTMAKVQRMGIEAEIRSLGGKL